VAAGRNDQEALQDSLRHGFASAYRILLGQQRSGRSSSIPALAPLVDIGMEKDPNFTIAFVEALPASRVKAEVLLDAAAALSAGVPPPHTDSDRDKQQQTSSYP
jgi:hypothetical protein